MKHTVISFKGIFRAISFRKVFTFIICVVSACQLWAQNTLPASSAEPAAKGNTLAASKQTKELSFEEVKNLLQKNTCLACHNPNTRQVGPAYKDVAKRKYTVAQIIELIHNPKPEHWPDYSTPMPPMTQVPNEEAHKIAEWIKSLEKSK